MKTSKKFLTAAITLIITLVAFAGCGSSDDNVSTYGNAAQNNNPHGAPPHVQNQPAGNQSTSTPATTPSPTANAPTVTPAPTAEPIQEVASQWNHAFTGITAFSEGLAWVRHDGGASVIDTSGNVVFSVEGDIYFFAPFDNGMSFYVTGRSTRMDDMEFFVIDRTGAITFSSIGQPHALYIAGMGGDAFVLIEHEVSFAVNEWRFRVTDRYGNDILPPRVENVNIADFARIGSLISFRYFGENTVYLSTGPGPFTGGATIIDLANNRWTFADIPGAIDIPVSTIQGGEFLTFTDHGGVRASLSLRYYGDGPGQGHSRGILSTHLADANSGHRTLRRYINHFSDLIVSFGNASDWNLTRGGSTIMYTEGLIWVQDGRAGAYYNRHGERVLDFPQFVSMDHVASPFENGFAALHVMGADGNLHITIVNRDGEVLYDPIPVTGANRRLSSGYVVFWTAEGNETAFHLLNVDGTTREIVRFAIASYNLNMFDIREGFVTILRIGLGGVANNRLIFLCIETGLQIGTFD